MESNRQFKANSPQEFTKRRFFTKKVNLLQYRAFFNKIQFKAEYEHILIKMIQDTCIEVTDRLRFGYVLSDDLEIKLPTSMVGEALKLNKSIKFYQKQADDYTSYLVVFEHIGFVIVDKKKTVYEWLNSDLGKKPQKC